MNVPSEVHAIEDLLAHSNWLRKLALRLIRDVAEAEEFVQETWLKALAKPPRKTVPIQPWLTRVLRNTVYEARRGGGRRRDREQRVAREEALPSTTELVGNVENQALLAQLVLELEEPYKSAVILRYYEGLTAAEIARRTDIPAGTIRWRLSEGLKRLKDALDRRHGGDRLAWCSALAPLAGIDPTVTAPTTGVIALTLGILTMKPLVSISLVVIGALIFTLTSDTFHLFPETQAPAPLESDELVSTDPVPEPEPQSEPVASAERVPLAAAPEPAAAVAPSPFLHLGGRVVDEQGRAVAGALLSKLNLAWGVEEQTDSAGRFDFKVKRPRYFFGKANLWLSAQGFARTNVEFGMEPEDEAFDLGDIVLAPGAVLRGHVRDEAGTGLADAEVFALPMSRHDSTSPFDKQHEYSALSHARTDENGRFVLSGVPLGFVDVWAQRDGLLGNGVQGVAPAADQETPDIELTLLEIPTDAVIAGIVLDVEGEPVPNAPLSITCSTPSSNWTRSDHADADGRFRLENEYTAPVKIVASGVAKRSSGGLLTSIFGAGGGSDSKGHRACAEDVQPGTRDLVLRLSEPPRLEVVACDERGHAVRVEQVTVQTRHSSETGGYCSAGAEVHREEELDGVWIHCPPGHFAMSIAATGYKTIEVGPFESDTVGDRVEIRLQSLPALTGVVTAGGEPLQNAVVQLYSRVPDNQEFTTERFPWLWLDVNSHGTVTDAEGRFLLPIDGDEFAASDDFVLRVSLDAFAPTFSRTFRLDVSPRPGEFDLELTAGGSIEGRLLLPDGASPAGMYIGASNGDGELLVQRTANDGSYRFERLMPGDWLLQWVPDEYGFGDGSGGGTQFAKVREPIPWSCQVLEGEVTNFDLDLRRPTRARLTGHLQVDGAGPGPWRVQLHSTVHRSRLIHEWIPGSVPLQLDGSFEFEEVPTGEYVLALVNGNRDAMTVTRRVNLIRGDQTAFIEYSTAPLSGRIERELGAEKLYYSHQTAGGETVLIGIQPDEAGSFELRAPLGPGKIQIGQARGSATPEVLLELDVSAQGALELELD